MYTNGEVLIITSLIVKIGQQLIMPITRVEVDEYECAKCGYKWISRVNGKDNPRPIRCAKCKRWDWNEGYIDIQERYYRDRLRHKFSRFKAGMFGTFRNVDDDVETLLVYRPTVEDMRLILEPMCYLFGDGHAGKIKYDKKSQKYKCVIDNDASSKAEENQLQVSKQLIEYFLEIYTAPYRQ
jgi:hypothetical protein